MSVETNLSPYYDDYSDEKNFHRVLFKPGLAVQARELTQSQTILQNQIKRMGDYFFTNGDKVYGPKSTVNLDCRNVKIEIADTLGKDIVVSNLLNKFVISPGSQVIGYVEYVYEQGFPEIEDGFSFIMTLKRFNNENDGMFNELSELHFYSDLTDALNRIKPEFTALTVQDLPKNIFCSTREFTKEIFFNQASDVVKVGDLLVHPLLKKKIYVTEIRSPIQIVVSDLPEVIIANDRVAFVTKATNPTSIVTQDSAIFYRDGFFIRSPLQSIVPDKNTAYPTKIIGYFYNQRIVDSNEDPSLLDPAIGASNYFAEGADRLQINLKLDTIGLDLENKPDTEDQFLPILKFDKGEINYVKESAEYSELDKKLAERTYDESGSYTVNRFTIVPVETTAEANTLVFGVSSGKAYVGGYQISTVGTTQVKIPKNIEFDTILGYNLNTTQGNYYKITDLRGSLPPVQEKFQHLNYLELHNVTKPTTAASRVGVIGLKSIEYDTYAGDKVIYKLFTNYYAPAKEVPVSVAAWAAKYNIPEEEGVFLAGYLYNTNNEITPTVPIVYTDPVTKIVTTITPAAGIRFYALNREPDTEGLAYWYRQWKDVYNGDVQTSLAAFIGSVLSASGGIDTFARLTDNTKPFLSVENGSPFYDGFININKVQSIVGVSNEYTQHITGANYTNPFFSANIAASGLTQTKNIVLFDKKSSDSLIFPTNKSFVKSLKNISTEYIKTFNNVAFSGGVYSKTLSSPEFFPIGNGNVPPSTARLNFTVLIKTGTTGAVPFGIWNFEAGSVQISGDSTILTINVGDASFNGTADINIRIENDEIQPRIKTLISNRSRIIDIDKADFNYSLFRSDITNFRGVYKLSNISKFRGNWSETEAYTYNDIVTVEGTPYIAVEFNTNTLVSSSKAWSILTPEFSAYYILDNGQRDAYYDYGYIRYAGPSNQIPGNVLVTFDYFEHGGEGPCTVQSYPEFYYDRIPLYRSQINATEFDLRDCLDFRPKRRDEIAYLDFQPSIFPVSTINTEADIEYYLGRKDRIYVTTQSQNFGSPYDRFYIEQGLESVNPNEPVDDSDLSKLSLAVIEIPPYTVSAFDVKITYDDNRRYTMKDLGVIDDLTIRLDKAVKLQSIEIDILRGIITNEQGDILLKSGILAEDFSSLDKSDLASGFFACAIDDSEKEAFPAFSAYNLDLSLVNDADIFVFNDLIMKKFQEEIFASQLEANDFVSVNPGAVDDGQGRAVISKKNSFLVNLLLTGGALILQGIAVKTIAAYVAASYAATASTAGIGGLAYAAASGFPSTFALSAAYSGEGILAVAWGAARDIGLSFMNATQSFSALTKFVTQSLQPYINIATEIYNWASGGVNSIISIFTGQGAGTSAIAGGAGGAATGGVATGSLSTAGVGSTIGQSISSIASTMSQIFNQPISATLQGLQTGFYSLAVAITTQTFGAIIVGANTLAAATVGVPIIGTFTASIASGAVTAANFILASPILTVIAAIVIVYVAVKIVQKVFKSLKKLFSDERTKENIKFVRKLSNGLNLYSYNYKKEFKNHPNAGSGGKYGYLASEVEKIYPTAVSISPEGYKMVDYSLIGKM